MDYFTFAPFASWQYASSFTGRQSVESTNQRKPECVSPEIEHGIHHGRSVRARQGALVTWLTRMCCAARLRAGSAARAHSTAPAPPSPAPIEVSE